MVKARKAKFFSALDQVKELFTKSELDALRSLPAEEREKILENARKRAIRDREAIEAKQQEVEK